MRDATVRDTTVHDASLLVGSESTIVAIATPPGRGALATIRISGAEARHVARALGCDALLAPVYVARTAARVRLRHPVTGAPLDDALATLFPGPHSFTGEDVVELSVHGGLTVPSGVLAACIAAGCRMAHPGEFTRRAVLNGRLDIAQAEAIADLIDARTGAMSEQALLHLDGGLSRRIASLREDLIGLEALLAYDIDFPGEDDGPIAAERITAAARALIDAMDRLLATAPRGAIVRDGAVVVIAGPPNAGKSSLFNALLGEGRALVTEIPGTTRDAIEALLDRAPTPLRLVDTAGLRDTTDPIERLGIEVSLRYLARAQAVLACGASDEDVLRTADILAEHTDGIVVPVRTKIDLDARSSIHTCVSAERGDGLAGLLAQLDTLLAAPSAETGAGTGAEPVLVTRERHRVALSDAREEVSLFLEGWSALGLPATVAAVHLFAARESLGAVTGVMVLDDVLDRVFRDFCIGK